MNIYTYTIYGIEYRILIILDILLILYSDVSRYSTIQPIPLTVPTSLKIPNQQPNMQSYKQIKISL